MPAEPYACPSCGGRWWHGPAYRIHDCPGFPQHSPAPLLVLDVLAPRFCRECGQAWPCSTAREANP